MADPRIDDARAAGNTPPGITDVALDESYDKVGIISISVMTGLSFLVIMCRLFSRKFIIKSYGLGLDDALALASLVVFIPFSVLCIVLINLGAARNFAFEPYIINQAVIQPMDSVAHLVYSTALILCRISGLAFYSRICWMDEKFTLSIKFVLAILLMGYLTQMGLIIFHCRPVTLMWSPLSEEDEENMYKCVQWVHIYSFISSVSLICDLLLFGLPAAMLKSLELPRKQKLQLAFTLFPGILVIGISAARIALVSMFGDETDENFQFAFLKLLCVEVAEISVTILALSFPGLKPMVDKFILRKKPDLNSADEPGMSSREEIKLYRAEQYAKHLEHVKLAD
ncbi:hypothetical protein ED733_005107 [Metarhizium rileyi]|uniref:Rhodopsin domain-containing protein n=1 Tax=Metarhizium rileyi (strain RCEF 4871) TaxID=1649241 RepID=A0A5C6GAB6_METRR|nr:hypothetical protein ED733_005107 [Metarhizium rileyi]